MASDAEPSERPFGRNDVMDALIGAAIDLIVEKGTSMSVREVAGRAGVNHGLVHAYFGSKEGLVQAAFDDIQRRTLAEQDENGFPPPDLAARRDALLAKALARAILDGGGSNQPFTGHRITASWRAAMAATRPDLDPSEIDERVAAASTIGLGYALFADLMADALELDLDQRRRVDERIRDLVATIGAIPVDVD